MAARAPPDQSAGHPNRFGDLERISGCRCRPVSRRAVTWCDWLTRLTLGFRSIAGTCSWPSFPGLSQAGRCPMTTAAPSPALVMIQPAFTDAERLALAGFLAGYRGLTREAYAQDLRQFTTWCRARSLGLFAVRRADIESFARELEARGRARATVTRRLCTIAGFYRYAVEEDLLDHSPAAHVRRPRVDYESHATGLDRNELGALLVAAGLGAPAEHALISLLALNGLRVPKPPALTSRPWASSWGTGRWWSSARAARSSPSRSRHTRPGRSTWPSANAARGRYSWPPMAAGWTGMVPPGSSARSPGAPGSPGPSDRTRLDTRPLPRRSMRGYRCGMCRKRLHTRTREPLCVTTGPARPWIDTPPISSPRTSLAQRDSPR